jgi:organic hydroperoxide reductase OsmC/OhrA
MATTETRIRPKSFHFPLAVDWAGGRKVTVLVADKAPLDVAPPPVFRGTEPDVWSPEDLFVAAAASCLAVTFTGLAERSGLVFDRLAVRADGTAGSREDGHFGFTRVELELRVAVAAADAALARSLCEQAEENCLVSASFDLPVDVAIMIDEID